jgi:hypothetical protein
VAALGATAAKALFGPSFRVTQVARRGAAVARVRPVTRRSFRRRGGKGSPSATIHPSAVLRADDRDGAVRGFGGRSEGDRRTVVGSQTRTSSASRRSLRAHISSRSPSPASAPACSGGRLQQATTRLEERAAAARHQEQRAVGRRVAAAAAGRRPAI